MNRSKFVQVQDYYEHLENKEKFTGKRPITLRSSYEIKFVKYFLDLNKSVLEWKSEDIVIPYYFSLDKRPHRYFVDFWMKVREKGNTIKEYLIEIKPYSQLFPPKQKNKTDAFKRRVIEYVKNQDKWKTAKRYCAEQRKIGRNIDFKIITERELFA